MGLELNVTIPAITVFIQGILSFFSPCILPIIPLYMGYLSSGTNDRKTVLINTIFFIGGISFAFFLLGLGFSTLGKFFSDYQTVFVRIGGVIIIVFGLIQLGLFNKPFGGREFKLPIKINILKMNPITALAMGFTFSFAWTPCVGPALSTVLIMVSSANSSSAGLWLMAIYTIGFTLPFLVVGIFTTEVLKFFKDNPKVITYSIKVGGIIMIGIGVMMITGLMNGFSGLVANSVNQNSDDNTQYNQDYTQDNQINDIDTQDNEQIDTHDNEQTIDLLPAIAFELYDQFGNVHTLEDYKGKVIFLNFWATWCPPCVAEMPDIQQLYEEYGLNENDVIVLGVASPNDNNVYTREGSAANVAQFLADNGYTYPTIMDMTGTLASSYSISAYPTTFMIDADGYVFGYVSGMLSYDIMMDIVEQTLNKY
ncbi:MAG: cytochrome C biogenesis protein [Epulopiscium sp. Nuni2H_MBin001]|nr:MAG: cytochrome C biogenesis protein [Epulopiscium sp. Nuni2H_MBin001]